MYKKTLLLDTNFQVNSFIGFKKTMKHLIKEKVEVISVWDNEFIRYGNGKIPYPSILRLKDAIRRNYFNANFSRSAVIKRDKSQCQYCGKKLSFSTITIDHVLPKAQGGTTIFANCVVACQLCNNKKADRTPEQAGMLLKKKPVHPAFTSVRHSVDQSEDWCDAWNDFLNF